jgi:carboxylate-amine ligase
MTGQPALGAFAGYGIELEYMIVDRRTLSVRPMADALLRACAGDDVCEVARGRFAWSNEVALHVIELKNTHPDATLGPLVDGFQAEVRAINAMLDRLGARIMPAAMHPWMNPAIETELWPHEHGAIYETYDRIFDCKRHGWANLQSMHVNLPFSDNDEFVRLHAAVRLLLPILPALAASSPIADNRDSGFLDFRMENYRTHQIRVPETIGQVIPENVEDIASYRTHVLAPMYHAIAPLDPAGILQHEWLNARGTIARFDRNALEIRVIDMQEYPQADLAIAAAAIAAIRALYAGEIAPVSVQQTMPTKTLVAILGECIRNAEGAVVSDAGYLNLLGFPGRRCEAKELWQHLIETFLVQDPDYAKYWREPLDVILSRGTLARRILHAVEDARDTPRLEHVYRELCDCAQDGRAFLGNDG